jgi:hypothetical protein
MLSPFKLLYGCPLLPITGQPEPPTFLPLSSILSSLFFALSLLWSNVHDHLAQSSDTTEITPSLQMGDLVYLKNAATPSHLEEKGRGPLKVMLTTPMAAKLAGFPTCQKPKTGSPTKDLPISSYRTNKKKISCLPKILEDRDTPTETPGV